MEANETAGVDKVSDSAQSQPQTWSSPQVWVPILVGAILVTLVLYLVKNDHDKGLLLGRIDGQLGSVSQRVDRIADALPDMKVRVAQEEVYSRPVSALIFHTVPEKDSEGKLVHRYYVVDKKTKRMFTYFNEIKDQTDFEKEKHTAIGSICNLEETCTSLNKLVTWTQNLKSPAFPVSIPDNIDLESSFVLHATSAKEIVDRWRPYRGNPAVQKNDTYSFGTAYDLLVDMRSNPQKYNVLSQQ